MKSYITNYLFLLLGLACPFLSSAQNDAVPLMSPSSVSPVTSGSSETIHLTYRMDDKKVFLDWDMNKNQDTDQFEIERSVDGKNFVLAALLFGTDKPGTENYRFYEKARSQKIFYRVKIIRKDRTAGYSDIVLTKKNDEK